MICYLSELLIVCLWCFAYLVGRMTKWVCPIPCYSLHCVTHCVFTLSQLIIRLAVSCLYLVASSVHTYQRLPAECTVIHRINAICASASASVADPNLPSLSRCTITGP